jgi:formylglycine-generating enzyme required for sulfatase activity
MIPFDWVTIPAGYFLMGSDKEQHRLYLPEYRIARVPVTVAQFGHFVAATHHETTAEKQGWAADWTGTNWQPLKDAYWEHPHGPNSDVQEDHPVTCISWDDAVEFCKWAGVRLPSEAEWEKAAAWDPGAQVKHVYPWGDELPDKSRCNFGMLVGDTTSVGRYPQGVNGLYDMAGNVWEWTSSLYKKYPYEADDRENAQATGERVVRGGSFFQPAKYVRCVHRHWHKPDATVSDFGFRVCGAERGGMIVIKRQHQR